MPKQWVKANSGSCNPVPLRRSATHRLFWVNAKGFLVPHHNGGNGWTLYQAGIRSFRSTKNVWVNVSGSLCSPYIYYPTLLFSSISVCYHSPRLLDNFPYAAAAVGNDSTHHEMPPAILMKLKVLFVTVDMPLEKYASSSRIYYRNVALRQRPIFIISLSEYPDKDSAFAPPLRMEWVSMCSIGMPFLAGYWSSVAAHLKFSQISWSVTSCRMPCTKYG